uniref:Uncharacterized protein n=1 Tax=Meloidogyne enterolobii TaxID=390850 RepID=A0A6V7U338_MELEN|nr:unnamed protein product [Meloidogyne enterolobii]
MSASLAEARAENGGSEKVSTEDNKSESTLEAQTNGSIEGSVESSLLVKTSKESNTLEQPEQNLNSEDKLKSAEDIIPSQKPIDNNLSNKESTEAKNDQEPQPSNNLEQPEEPAPATTESEIKTESAGEKLKNDQEAKETKNNKEEMKEDGEKKNIEEQPKNADEKTEVEEKMEVAVKREEEGKKEKEENNEAGKGAAKQGLPKWMVQSANAPPSPSPELSEKTGEKQDETAAPIKRRGRGRRSMAEKAAEAKQQINEGEEGQSEEALSPRPRRSTRSRVDYANPDPMTVVAEADDEEPGGGAKRITRNAPGRKPIVGRGRKRKVSVSEDEDAGHEYEDEDDEDYGSKKRVANKKRSSVGSAIGTPASGGIRKRGRGRPAAGTGKSSGKAPAKGRAPRGGGFAIKRLSRHDKDSDDEHSEVVYDDRESDKDPTTEDDSADEKQQQTKSLAPVMDSKVTTPVKAQTKKRGRPAGARQQKQGVSDGKRRDDDSNDDG